MTTPEGHQFEPCDMAWCSPACSIAREWRLMMADDGRGGSPGISCTESSDRGEIQRHLPGRSAQNSPRTTVRRA
ncbi:hypothetical protein [Stenotrophomonas pavanii]|uniref:hypothetical protein n=1 Tax=Stenotrophomonas pavanii TaxID=487698 RepID=UPI00383B1ED0